MEKHDVIQKLTNFIEMFDTFINITKKIINKHNGDIKIIASDCGTNFEINIPIVK